MRKFLIRQTIHLSPICYNISYSLVLSADLTICAGLNERWPTEKNATLFERGMSTFPGIRNSWIWNTGTWPGFSAAGAGIQISGKVPFDGSRGRDLEHSECLASDPDEGKEKVSCMVCALDGHIYRTYVLLHPGEALSEDQRQRLLNHIIPGQTGIVICDRDEVKDVPDMPVGHSDVVE